LGEKEMPAPLIMRPVSFMLALPVSDEREAWEHFGKEYLQSTNTMELDFKLMLMAVV